MKIFAIGFYKTGTKSLGEFISALDYQHYYGSHLLKKELDEAELITYLFKKDYVELFNFVDQYDALSGFPWFVIYEELDKYYPNSKFVLTIRDEQQWLEGMLNNFQTIDSTFRMWSFGRLSPLSHENIYLKFYRKHNQKVIEYFSNKKNLLVLNIEDDNKWKKLYSFLGKPLPNNLIVSSNRRENNFRTYELPINHHKRAMKHLKKLSYSTLNKTLFISSFPKSGSTYLCLLLQQLTDYKHVRLDYSHLQEQNLYLPALQQYENENTITKHHTLPTTANIDLMNSFNIAPIVLTRNIFDTLISLRDHILKKNQWHNLTIPEDFKKFTNEKQINFLIDFALPWYISFFVSWKEAEKNKTLPILFLSYEEVINDIENTLIKVSKHWNISLLNLDFENTLHAVNSKQRLIKKNIGKIGRGTSQITTEQKRRIRNYVLHYPHIDFSFIGISKNNKHL